MNDAGSFFLAIMSSDDGKWNPFQIKQSSIGTW